MQNEDGFTVLSYDMNVCGAMVVWVNDYAKAVESKDGWHGSINLIGWELRC